MKVLVLSCNTGEGHNSAARAMVENIKSHGDEAELLDMMMLSGRKVSRAVGGSYVSVVKHAPHLFHLLYKAGQKVSSSHHKSPVYYANALLAKQLEKYIKDHQFDIILTTHLFPAETLTYLKNTGRLDRKVIAVATDYTCIPFWEETDCDYYVIPHKDLISEFSEKGISKRKLKPYGIPVRATFSKERKKEEARRKCGLPEDAKVYLIMSGSMGFGKVQVFVSLLRKRIQKNEYIVVVCGNNQKLYRILSKEFGRYENVKILGYTNQIASYMDAGDVLFTKPGGLTSTEAAVKEIPIIHTNPIPGCETKNLKFFSERKLSIAPSNIALQIYEGRKIIREAERRQMMRESQREVIPKDAADRIYQLMRKLFEEERRQ